MANLLAIGSYSKSQTSNNSSRSEGTSVHVWGHEETNARVCIKDLSPNLPNTVIVGVVILKQALQSFPDKKNFGSLRYKFCFTLRDSSSDYINVTVWGSELYATRLFSLFGVNDVVQLFNCQISSKTGGEADEKWRPWTPSPFQLNVSELHTTVALYNERDGADFTHLAHVPLRPSNDYYTLSDILMNGMSLDGAHVNLLAGIKSVGASKDMTSKSGKPLKKCEVRLIDKGCSSFTLLIWDSEIIKMAQSWTPRQNIIFAVDVRVSYDQYRNTMTASCNSKTIITTNPDCPEAHHLYQFLQSVEPDLVAEEEEGSAKQGSNDLKSISTIYTISQINQLDKPSSFRQEFNKPSVVEGITYAFITSLDIDGEPSASLTERCSQCRFRVPSDSTSCCNRACPSKTLAKFTAQTTFDIPLSLSDHTDTIQYVKLTGEAANQLLQTTPTEFQQMTKEDRCDLKAKLILEKFKIYFKWISFVEQRASMRILNASLADPLETLSQCQLD